MLEVGKEEIITLLVFLVAVISAAVTIIKMFLKREQERLDRFEEAHKDSQKAVLELTIELTKIRTETKTSITLCEAVLKRIDENVNATN